MDGRVSGGLAGWHELGYGGCEWDQVPDGWSGRQELGMAVVSGMEECVWKCVCVLLGTEEMMQCGSCGK